MAEKKNNSEAAVFLREGESIWRCRICGRVSVGHNIPEICPVCGEKKSFFRVEPERY